jgi:SAM-dependent methyltransferase
MRELARIRPKGVSLTGIDSNADVLRIAGKVMAGARRVRLECMDGRALRYDDASFEAVLCSRLLVLASNVESIVTEMARVLRPAGHVFIVEPACAVTSNVGDDVRGRVFGQRNPAVGRQVPSLMRALGLRIEKIVPYVRVERVPPNARSLLREFRSGRGVHAMACQLRRCTAVEVEDYVEALRTSIEGRWYFDAVLYLAVLASKPGRRRRRRPSNVR